MSEGNFKMMGDGGKPRKRQKWDVPNPAGLSPQGLCSSSNILFVKLYVILVLFAWTWWCPLYSAPLFVHIVARSLDFLVVLGYQCSLYEYVGAFCWYVCSLNRQNFLLGHVVDNSLLIFWRGSHKTSVMSTCDVFDTNECSLDEQSWGPL